VIKGIQEITSDNWPGIASRPSLFEAVDRPQGCRERDGTPGERTRFLSLKNPLISIFRAVEWRGRLNGTASPWGAAASPEGLW